jgi:EAL domain-containing protein (putative c-di-GMP-specific phosphodiesterase class I)
VIADGVVSDEDLQFFKWESCDIGQGDLLAKPMAVADVSTALLSDLAPANRSAHLH